MEPQIYKMQSIICICNVNANKPNLPISQNPQKREEGTAFLQKMVKPTTPAAIATAAAADSSSSSPPTPGEGDQTRFRGVRKRKWGKWVSEIRLPNSRERIWLGSYDAPEKAARAFDAAAFCLRGRNAKLNFPNNLPDIAVGSCLAPSEIQVVAARFANQALPQPENEAALAPEGGLPMQCDGTVDWSFLDPSAARDSSFGYFSDFGEFPGDGETFAQPPLMESDSVEENENNEAICYSQISCNLWNF